MSARWPAARRLWSLALALSLLGTLAAACAPAGIPSPLPGAGAANTAPPDIRTPLASPRPSATPPPLPGAGAANPAPPDIRTPLVSPLPSATPAPLPGAGEVNTVPPGIRTPLASPLPSAAPLAWQDLPVLPALSERARAVLQKAIQHGANLRAFAKAGDCETLTDWFLTDFDRGPRFYNLGPYPDLQAVIDYYQGSFKRASLAARRGFNAAALLTPFWADQSVCQPDETPLGCELRILNPAFVLIMVGTNDVPRKDSFEPTLRKVIDFSLARGVLPVLVTKADNLEGDESINASIGRLAQEYGLPVWNFWRAVQDLPGHGLVEDGAHLTFLPNDFSNPANLQAAWPVRNLNALQVLNILMDATEKN
jgi:hypothetical protein